MERVKRKELATYLGVAVTTISTWKSRYANFPSPVGRYYDLEAVLNWISTYHVPTRKT
jgi:hypothetical protein